MCSASLLLLSAIYLLIALRRNQTPLITYAVALPLCGRWFYCIYSRGPGSESCTTTRE
uniref:Uncharacterized protein n=1 Tax=Arundo donax TaxID=35708 RepID=A0A0A9GAF5_ARUDO